MTYVFLSFFVYLLDHSLVIYILIPLTVETKLYFQVHWVYFNSPEDLQSMSLSFLREVQMIFTHKERVWRNQNMNLIIFYV